MMHVISDDNDAIGAPQRKARSVHDDGDNKVRHCHRHTYGCMQDVYQLLIVMNYDRYLTLTYFVRQPILSLREVIYSFKNF